MKHEKKKKKYITSKYLNKYIDLLKEVENRWKYLY